MQWIGISFDALDGVSHREPVCARTPTIIRVHGTDGQWQALLLSDGDFVQVVDDLPQGEVVVADWTAFRRILGTFLVCAFTDDPCAVLLHPQ